MSINAENKSKPRELIPAGNHVARCIGMIEIGNIMEQDFNTRQMKKACKVMVTWELPDELRIFDEKKGKQPLVVSKEYTLSMNEKANLRKDLESWRSKGFTEIEAKSFDITVLLGIPCMLNISHIPKPSNPTEMKEKIVITSLPKGLKVPDQINPFTILSYDNFDDKVFEKLPDFLKTKIKSSEEYRALNTPPDQKHVNQDYDDLTNGINEPFDPNISDLPF